MANARKHSTPDEDDLTVTWQTIFEVFGESISDVVPVANMSERAQVAAALASAGVGPSSARPLVVIRGDAPGLRRIEYTYDGSTWMSAGGLVFATLADADTWAASNAGVLAKGDTATIGGVLSQWTGTGWDYRHNSTAGLVFGNGFVEYIGSGWTGVRYWRRAGLVFGNGAASNPNAWAVGKPVFQLPVGFRPPVKWQGVSCTVEPDGNVVAGAAGGAFSFSFSYPVTY